MEKSQKKSRHTLNTFQVDLSLSALDDYTVQLGRSRALLSTRTYLKITCISEPREQCFDGVIERIVASPKISSSGWPKEAASFEKMDK